MKPYTLHPHILKPSQTPSQEDPENIPICSACDDPILPDSPIHTCPNLDCNFTLHKSCFDLPKTLQHPSHPAHQLALLSEQPPHSLYYDCNACGSLINTFSFYCRECDFRVHVKCALLPESIDCKAHPQHALGLQYQVPDKDGNNDDDDDQHSFVLCDVCDGCVTKGYWCYYCTDCRFCSHLECGLSAEEKSVENGGEEDIVEGLSDMERLQIANIKAMDQMARLNFQMQMAELNAATISMMFRTRID